MQELFRVRGAEGGASHAEAAARGGGARLGRQGHRAPLPLAHCRSSTATLASTPLASLSTCSSCTRWDDAGALQAWEQGCQAAASEKCPGCSSQRSRRSGGGLGCPGGSSATASPGQLRAEPWRCPRSCHRTRWQTCCWPPPPRAARAPPLNPPSWRSKRTPRAWSQWRVPAWWRCAPTLLTPCLPPDCQTARAAAGG